MISHVIVNKGVTEQLLGKPALTLTPLPEYRARGFRIKIPDFETFGWKMLYICMNSLSTKHKSKGKNIMKIRGLLIGASCIALSAASAFAQYSIVSSVIGSGGGPMSNGTYSMNGTVGQAVVGPTSGASYTVDQGFWHTLSITNDVRPVGGANVGYDLEQNFPNPFNPTTTIRFSVPERVKVTLKVMNLLGEEVKRVIDGVYYDAGTYDADFFGDGLPSGTYVYRLEAGNFVKSRKMVIAK